MAFQTVKAIKNLEIASICNLACEYCPCRLQGGHREVGLMTEEVFERSLFWLKKFVDQGTQAELNFFGVGESLLHPDLVDWIRRTRAVLPKYHGKLLINTNGILFTEELGRELYDAGIDKIDLTDHEARASTKTIAALRRITGQYSPSQEKDSRWGYSRDGIINPNNWGGLLDWVPEVQHARYICPWLSNGQVMIMSSGDVTRCCQDAFARGVIGTVFEEIDRIEYGRYIQCKDCHEIVPDWISA